MADIFKIYGKEKPSNKSDTIFSIIGRSEPDLTKSLAFLLHYSRDFLEKYLVLVSNTIDLSFIQSFVTAEQRPDLGLDRNRRDIAIFLNYKNADNNTLIITEAKSLHIKDVSSVLLTKQVAKYFKNESFSDVNKAHKKIGVTLTKNRILFSQSNLENFDCIVSVTWQDILHLISDNSESLLQAYKQEIMDSNFIRTYEEEVFCPPVGDTFSKVQSLGIYCCPADRSLKDAIYLMPRVPVSKVHELLGDLYNITDFTSLKGKGCSVALYKINNSFIVDGDSIAAIENELLKVKVLQWMNGKNESLKVFVLGEPMNFHKPKFTDGPNNSWNGYFALSQVWGELISKK
jgi:hypothetical protein